MSGKFLATAPVYPDPNDDFYMTLKKFSVLFGQIQSGAVAPFPISGGGGGGGAVSSVFSRTGAVTAQTGDYAFSQISGIATNAQGGLGFNNYNAGQYAGATGVFAQLTNSQATGGAFSIQNLAAAGFTSFVATADTGTNTTNFAEFGINNSTWPGTGSLNLPLASYATATGGDLVLGTTTANAIRFVLNGATVDSLTMSVPAASVAGFSFPTAPYAAGTATTNFPLAYFNTTGATAPTTLSTGGTFLGFNAASGFAGRFIDCHVNGGLSLFRVDNTGALTLYQAGGAGSTLLTFSSAGTPSCSISQNGAGYPTFSTSIQADGNFTTLVTGPAIVLQSQVFGVGTVHFALVDTGAANQLQFNSSAASPAAFTLLGTGSRGGTDTNTPGAALTICAGLGTGNAVTGANLNLAVSAAGSSGTAQQSPTTLLSLNALRKTINIAGVPTSSAGLSTGDIYSNAGILTVV